MQGKKVWFFPDGDRPPLGDSEMKGHESYVVLNPNKQNANLKFSIYFEDREPVRNIKMMVEAERVKCFQTHNPRHFGENTLPVASNMLLRLKVMYRLSFNSEDWTPGR